MSENKEQSGKIKKAFEKSMSQITAILGNPKLFEPLKAEKEDIQSAMEELAKEEKEELVKKVKEEARILIKEKRAFDNLVNQKKKEFDKTVEEEQKKFTEKVKGILKLVKNIQTIEQEYLQTLKNATTETIATAVEEKDEDDDDMTTDDK